MEDNAVERRVMLMIVAKFAGGYTSTVYGLTQWDYGQELAIEYAGMNIPDGTEVNFYQGKLSSTGYLKSNHVLIPDLMLQAADIITAYVYIRMADRGETILSIRLPIRDRPQPDNYVLPEYKEYLRLLPPGGDAGQTLVKKTAADYDTEWIEQEAGLEPMTDEDVDKICV